jgi:large subunit ribosomal protein L4
MSKQKNIETDEAISSKISSEDLGLDNVERLVNPVAFSTCVRVSLQNWRQGTVACKTRSQVARTNKKPWKQKGTGRARAGSARSPLWRGGGIIFGPQPRTRVLDINKKVRRKTFGDLLQEFLNSERVICLNWSAQGEVPKTAVAFKALQAAQLHDKKINIFIPAHDSMTQVSFANIPLVRLMLFDQANAFDLANSDYWVFLKKDFDAFKEMVSKWI